MSQSKEKGIVQKSYDNLWSESKKTKSLLKFFSAKDLKNASTGGLPPEEPGVKSYTRFNSLDYF